MLKENILLLFNFYTLKQKSLREKFLRRNISTPKLIRRNLYTHTHTLEEKNIYAQSILHTQHIKIINYTEKICRGYRAQYFYCLIYCVYVRTNKIYTYERKISSKKKKAQRELKGKKCFVLKTNSNRKKVLYMF